MTFSIVGRCARTGMAGIAISSSSPAVAGRCAHVRPGVGAVAVQNLTDPRLGPLALDMLANDVPADGVIARLIDESPHIQYRQLAIVGPRNDCAVFSGTHALGCAAECVGDGVAAAGNMLANASIPREMVRAFAASAAASLAERLLNGLEAALAAGGEAGPVKSAGLLIGGPVSWPIIDLRVDWDEAPITRLRTLWGIWKPQASDYVTRALDPTTAPSFMAVGRI